MRQQVVVLLRRPEQIPQGLAMARQLGSGKTRPQVVFLCPGCASHLDCRAHTAVIGKLEGPCFTDRGDDCGPLGFHPAEESRIARLLREAHVVVPIE